MFKSSGMLHHDDWWRVTHVLKKFSAVFSRVKHASWIAWLLKSKTLPSFETSVIIHQFTQSNTPKPFHLQQTQLCKHRIIQITNITFLGSHEIQFTLRAKIV